jgi:hypothetical protein
MQPIVWLIEVSHTNADVAGEAHLARFGIASVSVDPDAAHRTRRVVASAEQQSLLDAARSGQQVRPQGAAG